MRKIYWLNLKVGKFDFIDGFGGKLREDKILEKIISFIFFFLD
jgi:hypothetical protein